MNRNSIEIRCAHVGRNTRRDPVWLDVWWFDYGRWSSTIEAAPEVNRGEVRETKRGWKFTCPMCGLSVAVRHSRLVANLNGF